MTTARALGVACFVAGCTSSDTRYARGDADSLSTSAAPSVCSVPAPAADSAQRFAQSFYDWYVPLGNALHESQMDSVLLGRANMFAPSLVASLKDDLAAQQRAQEIVSVLGDYDPFLNSQDPCERYEARETTPYRGGYAVAVYGICADGTSTLAVLADMERVGTTWVFANFRMPAEPLFDLVSQLKAAKALRDSTTKRKSR